MLRFGIIGTGRIGDMHARLVALQPDAVVTCCYDVYEDNARRTAQAVGARATTDVDALLGLGNHISSFASASTPRTQPSAAHGGTRFYREIAIELEAKLGNERVLKRSAKLPRAEG